MEEAVAARPRGHAGEAGFLAWHGKVIEANGTPAPPGDALNIIYIMRNGVPIESRALLAPPGIPTREPEDTEGAISGL